MVRVLRNWTLSGIALIVLMLLLAWYFLWERPFSARVFYGKAFLEFTLQQPQTLSQMRLLERLGIRGHNARLNDMSVQARQRYFALIAKDLDALRSYDRAGLRDQNALSYDIMEFFLESELARHAFEFHDYPVNQIGGVQVEFPRFMTAIHHIGDKKDAVHYVSRLQRCGIYFDQVLDDLRVRKAKNILPPRFVVEKVLDEMHEFVGNIPEQNVLYTHLEEQLGNLNKLDAGARAQLLADAAVAINETVYPAYARLIASFESLRAATTTDHGVWKLPRGAEFYQYKLRQSTTTDLTAEEIHAQGLTEVARLVSAMDARLIEQGLSDGTVGERMTTLRNRAEFLYADTDAGRAQVLQDYRDIISAIQGRAHEWFDIEITAPVEVRRVPEILEARAAGAYYQRPALDGSRPGVFFANLRDLGGHPRFGMRTLAYHEAIPGHHYQLAIMTELKDVPQFRHFLSFTAFTEGWALYAERLAYETGLHKDPYSDLGRLQAEMLCAVRLVVDTGLHHARWSRQQAMDYMVAHTGMTTADAVTEIERNLVWPGQATSYKIGMLKILELRDKARAELGAAFDLRRFHRAVLENGTMPLFLLERQIEHYIETQKQQSLRPLSSRYRRGVTHATPTRYAA